MTQRLSSIKEHTGKRETKERTTSANTVVFPRVKTLILDELPKFTGSSSSRDGFRGVKWLELDTVEVSSCPNIGESMLGKVDRSLLKKVTVKNCRPWAGEDLESNIGYLSELTDEISKIENLRIDDSKELQKYMRMELHESSFRQLKTVEAFHCGNELNEFLSILLRRSSKLERLTVESCDLLEQVFHLTGIVAEEGNLKFPNLKTMRLCSLRNLKCIWNKDPRRIVELGKLVKLEIIDCGLRQGPLSIALLEKLVLLEELKIESCKMLEQVVEDNEEMQERSFHGLKDLYLADLPELIKFSSRNCNVGFPNLLRLTIKKCPKLIEFTAGLLSNQKGTSGGVPQKEMMHACPKLERLILEGLELLSVEVVSLSKLSYMRIAGSNKLNRLVVRNCSSLRSLELPTKCLNLKEIEISDCNILEEIATDRVEGGKTDQETSGHLESIVLENLPKLSFLSSETCEFPSLKKLRIINCPEVGKKLLSGNVSAKAADHSSDKVVNVFFKDIISCDLFIVRCDVDHPNV
ncbi:disease resistance protein SUMM2-like [Neltuma alba]|uniref:disease resistance protein SUMM2-like n=1 Tax=Neltuma alba TaxID=207710 RepID=UPI0010A5188F|nr:disease resistance protein SUMM2-like [Prosopis alba]